MRADARRNHDRILAAARDLFASGGVETSLRDVARTADVGLGTLYRRFPTREALLEALLRDRFEALAGRAIELEQTGAADAALITWLREVVAVARAYSGAIRAMVAAIENEGSALHASCAEMKAAGSRLLAAAQSAGTARNDIDDVDLFALVGAIAWIGDQPSLVARSDQMFGIVTDGILIRKPSRFAA